MNNLHRELAPVSDAAWASIEEEAKRTFALHVAGRRVVDVTGPDGTSLAAVGTGHRSAIAAPADGIIASLRTAQQLVELRVPFTLSREAIDDVERGAQDPDWQPVKDAAKKTAFAEDRAIFEGYPAAGIAGIRQSSSNPALALPAEARQYPDVVSQALSALRLAGVTGPYSLLLSADAYTSVGETSDYGYPVRDHLARVVDERWDPPVTLGARFTFRRGRLYEYSFDRGGASFAREYARGGRGRESPGALTFGLNPAISRAPEVAEVAAGTVGLLLGGNRSLGGRNPSRFAYLTTLAEANVELDGLPFLEDGRAVPGARPGDRRRAKVPNE